MTGHTLERLPIWFNGPLMTNIRPDVKPCASIRFSALARMASWLIITPLLRPVVPVVNRMSAVPSGMEAARMAVRISSKAASGRLCSRGTITPPRAWTAR